KRKRRRDKNSLVPKHPLCAYMWYLTEERPDTLKNNPGMSVGQVSKICADRWNNMSDEARSPWRKQAQMDKERYAKE
ncbi:high mobility group box domain-containing protein, partial [Pilobolus umbonatus]